MSVMHVELLTKARRNLKTKHNDYICTALSCAADTIEEEAIAWQIRCHIMKLLDGNYTLKTWLMNTHGIECDIGSAKLRATRLAWIDWLIEEWRDAP